MDSDDVVAVDVVSSSTGWRRAQRPSSQHTERDSKATRTEKPSVAAHTDASRATTSSANARSPSATASTSVPATEWKPVEQDVVAAPPNQSPNKKRTQVAETSMNSSTAVQSVEPAQRDDISTVHGASNSTSATHGTSQRVSTGATVRSHAAPATRGDFQYAGAREENEQSPLDTSVRSDEQTDASVQNATDTAHEHPAAEQPLEEPGLDYCRFCGKKAEVRMCSKCMSVSCECPCLSSPSPPRHCQLLCFFQHLCTTHSRCD
jgi:hypothetical protein